MECVAEGDGIDPRSSRRHRHADLDEDIRVHWAQRPHWSERGRQSRVPLGRLGQAQHIASGVLFLASEPSNYVPQFGASVANIFLPWQLGS